MAPKSPISPVVMKQSDESHNKSPVDGNSKTLGDNTTQSVGNAQERKSSVPINNLSIHPTPYATLQTPIFSPQAFAVPPNNERSYLLENRQRQHERGERLADALHIIEVRITSTQSKAEARKLRKEAGLLKKKIAECHRQEQLISLRLKDIDNEEYSRAPYWQAQSAGVIPYAQPWSPYSPMTPWTPMTLPMMSPVHGPVSPLTPLGPGLFHPSPVMPSPMTSPYWLGSQYQYPCQTMGPYVHADPAFYTGAVFQQHHMPEDVTAGQPLRRQSVATTSAKSTHKADKSVDFKLPHDSAFKGRRWSLADTFSPTPKDKRMSIPGLETIWKNSKEVEGKEAEQGHVELDKAVE